jgi:hypothetical protein
MANRRTIGSNPLDFFVPAPPHESRAVVPAPSRPSPAAPEGAPGAASASRSVAKERLTVHLPPIASRTPCTGLPA